MGVLVMIWWEWNGAGWVVLASGALAPLEFKRQLEPLGSGLVFVGPVVGGFTAFHERLVLWKFSGFAPDDEHNVHSAAWCRHGGDDVGDGGAGCRVWVPGENFDAHGVAWRL